jgi:acyl carrier protein
MADVATPEQIEERLTEAIASFGPEPDQVTRDARFEDLDVDSLDLVELAQVAEEEYGVKLSSDDMKGIETVGQAIDLVTERAS